MDRNSSSFMVVNIPLDTQMDGFDGLTDLGAGNTIVFTHIPAGVAVYFAIDNNSQSKIQALQGMQIKTNHGGIYFTTVGTSADPMILAHWASDDMEIITPPLSTFESLNGFGIPAFNQLDKVANPYASSGLTSASTSSGVLTTLVNKVLNCDKIRLSMFGSKIASIQDFGMVAYLNNVPFASASATTTYSQIINFLDSFENIRGKTLRIEAITGSSAYSCSVYVEEFTLKP